LESEIPKDPTTTTTSESSRVDTETDSSDSEVITPAKKTKKLSGKFNLILYLKNVFFLCL